MKIGLKYSRSNEKYYVIQIFKVLSFLWQVDRTSLVLNAIYFNEVLFGLFYTFAGFQTDTTVAADGSKER